MSTEKALTIIHINTLDCPGGAAKIAQTLHQGCEAQGHASSQIVGYRRDRNSGAIEIDNDRYRAKKARLFISIGRSLAPLEGKRLGATALRKKIAWLGQLYRLRSVHRGEEDFDFPGTQHILEMIPQLPDIVHCHNLHGGYFDLRYLVELSKIVPVVVTLHDEWMMTGHCACTIGCEKWKTGCGECPDLEAYPAIARDASSYNYARKKEIYSRSRLFVATPSRWLMDKVGQSILVPAIADSRVIHNGVDLEIFRPNDKSEARSNLGIRQGAKVMLFVANGIRNSKFKDFQTLRESIARAAAQLPDIDLQFVALGEKAEPEQIGNATVTFVPYSRDPGMVAAYYQAADVYLHAAHTDNFPTTVLESLACGVPVVATAVGGIPEQIDDGVTGFLVPAKDSAGMAERICELLSNDMKREEMGRAAAEAAKAHFGSELMAERYLNWYADILNES